MTDQPTFYCNVCEKEMICKPYPYVVGDKEYGIAGYECFCEQCNIYEDREVEDE